MTWRPLERSRPYKNGVPIEEDPDTTQWANDEYVVFRREIQHKGGEPPMFHLSIRNQDRSTRHDWRDFQRIKNQLCGPEYEGCELYPQESRKVDTANQYHLFCFPFSLGFGLGEERMVTDPEVTEAAEQGAVQVPNEPVDGPLNDVEDLKAWSARHGGDA